MNMNGFTSTLDQKTNSWFGLKKKKKIHQSWSTRDINYSKGKMQVKGEKIKRKKYNEQLEAKHARVATFISYRD